MLTGVRMRLPLCERGDCERPKRDASNNTGKELKCPILTYC